MKRNSAVAIMFFLLSGCATLVMPRLLPTGEWSVMNEENTRLRAQLAITDASLPQDVTYIPVENCLYRGEAMGLSGRLLEFEREIAIRSVQERLLISYNQNGTDSTAIIDKYGRLLDFNTVQLNGYRTDTESFPSYAEDQARLLRRQPHVYAEIINELKIAYPHFTTGNRHAGSVVATVTDAYDRSWALYVYRGMVNHDGTSAAVLDLIKRDHEKGWITIGFNLFDVDRAVPLLYVMDSGSAFRLKVERASCDS